MIALVLLLLLGNSTIERNRDYRSQLAIWRTVVKARPDNPRGHNNLGKAYYEVNALDSARVHFRAAVALKPHYPDAWELALGSSQSGGHNCRRSPLSTMAGRSS